MQASMRKASLGAPSRAAGAFQKSVVPPGAAFMARARRSTVSRRQPTCVASLTVKDQESGVEFPLAETFWVGDEFRCLGTATRAKKIMMIPVQVYVVGLYVEAEKAAKELGLRQRGGFFGADADYATALLDGAFGKTLVVELLRDVTGQQFAEALDKTLGPRMKLTGETAVYDQFLEFFTSRQLPKGMQVVMYWTAKGELDLATVAPGAQVDLRAQEPALRLPSPGLCRALFEVFLGDSPVVPAAVKAWVEGAKQLLDSEVVKRESR